MRFSAILCVTTLLLAGCDNSHSKIDVQTTTKSAASIPLRVAVYETAAFAKRIESGWQGVSEQPVTTMVVVDQTLSEVAAANDLIVMPARMMGQAVTEKLISPLPEKFLGSESLSHDQFLPQLRETQTRWSSTTYGLSLGSPTPMTLVRDDVPDVPQDEPLTYQQFAKLAESVSTEQPRAAEPLADGAAAISFLQRAAASTVTPWLFSIDSFEPVIDAPPYVRALQQMIEARKFYPQEALTATDVWHRIVDGRLKVAIGWPIDSAEIEDDASVRILPAPIASELYTGLWKPNDGSLPVRSLLPGSGLIVVISSACRQTSASRDLATWMVTEGHDSLRRISPHVSVARSDSESTQRMRSAAVSQYDRLVRAGLSRSVAHSPLRIPHADKYLTALDASIQKALAGQTSAEQALSEAKVVWQTISLSAGINKQRDAWNQGRGL